MSTPAILAPTVAAAWRAIAIASADASTASGLPPRETFVRHSPAATVGARIAGVDILPGPDGPVVLEVNAVPAWRGLQSVVDADLTEAVAQEVEKVVFSA